jgi:hypothetical protein
MKDTQQRFDMKMSSQSHRGNPGSSSAKNSHQNPPFSKEVGNVKKTHIKTSSQGPIRRSERDNDNSPVNLLPETDGIRGIGVGKQDATPRELYAIGAVFDHIYRGGSPLNCISVFQKEVHHAPRRKQPYGCGGFGCGSSRQEEASIVTKAVSADDDTFGTMEWTYTRSSLEDTYTLDEFGTYDRSFISRDSTFQSSLDQPWDEEHFRDIEMSSPYWKNRIKFRKHISDGSSVDMNKSDSRDISNSEMSSLNRKQDDTMKRVMSQSKVLVAVAMENPPIAVAAASKATSKAANAAAGAGATARTENTTSFVHMFRNTMAKGIPEKNGASTATTLQAALSSLVRKYASKDEDDFYSTDGSYDASISSPPRPLNSLAKAMRSIANKEPTRTYAVSERDQVVGKDAATKSTRLKPMNDVSSSAPRGTDSKTSASSVGATIESNVTPPQEIRGETSSISPISADSLSPFRRYLVSKFSPSRRRHRPPVPPVRSPTTPSASSPSRNLYLSSDNDGSELSIIGHSEENGADNVSVITPDRSTAAPIPSSSPKSLSCISIKKIFSFWEQKTTANSRKDKYCTNANSPRGVNTQIFQSATADTRTDLLYEESIIAESIDNNDIIIVTPLNFDKNDTSFSTTDGVLFTVNNQEERSMRYKVFR